ncbi:MAG: 30S ribosomal protein S21 [Puniceicoccales bacterium]|jgi:small subunit ribosomal protein S21|nr:30S ribosomal protein S21 [Puniceicoccales bacterium]
MPVDVTIRKGETLDKALRRLKKKIERESILRDVRAKRYFEKPCEKRRRLKKIAVFNNMLRRKYENM